MALPKGARLQADGSFYLPNKGIPPKFIPGYIADQGNPFYFRPILKLCKFREWKETICCGGHKGKTMYCNLFKGTIDWNSCKDCTQNET